jgi:hypothetical protein
MVLLSDGFVLNVGMTVSKGKCWKISLCDPRFNCPRIENMIKLYKVVYVL